MVQVPHEKLVILSELAELGRTQRTIVAKVAEAGYDENASFAVRLALDEALSNAVRHGNCGDPNKRVIVEYCIDDSAVEIAITDEGCGFRPQEVADPTLDENLDRPDGRGIMLMKAYMSEVHYNDRGNRVTIVKRKHCPLPGLPNAAGGAKL